MTIKSIKNIRKTITIPNRYNQADREEIGQRIIKTIKRRTAAGLDVSGKAFRYAKGSPYSSNNLKDTGDMLTELDVINTVTGQINIGFTDPSSIEANQAEGNQIGSYGKPSGDPSIAKPFIGVSAAELSLILAKYDQDKSSLGAEEEQVSVTDSFISSILKQQGILDE